MLLKDKVALVTGAGAGIGRAIAQAYGARGAKVMVTDLNGDNAAKVAREIVASGGTATSAPLDVIDREQQVAVVTQDEKKFGRLDIAANNAGITIPAPAPVTSATLSFRSMSSSASAHRYSNIAHATIPAFGRVASSKPYIRPYFGRSVAVASVAIRLKKLERNSVCAFADGFTNSVNGCSFMALPTAAFRSAMNAN